jgi:hypothetical protein
LTGSRLGDLKSFYESLELLTKRVGGLRKLGECSYSTGWPVHGVYFFFENGENRSQSGAGLRVVRVGTHAINPTSKTTLWDRLSNHRGHVKGPGGNHWNSIFRHHVGTALLGRQPELTCSSWNGERRDPTLERDLEVMVSETIRAMPFVWIPINEEAGGCRQRDYLERNAIALLSNFDRLALDPPSDHWLGTHCKSDKVRRSGLWNDALVANASYDLKFIDSFHNLVAQPDAR